MGQTTSLPVATAARFRDDYGANGLTKRFTTLSFRDVRKFPVVQSLAVAAVGGQNHAI